MNTNTIISFTASRLAALIDSPDIGQPQETTSTPDADQTVSFNSISYFRFIAESQLVDPIVISFQQSLF